MLFCIVKNPKKRPKRQRDEQRKRSVWQQDSGEQKQTNARRHAQASQQPLPPAECPVRKTRRHQAKGDHGKSRRNTRSPVLRAKYPLRDRNHPVEQRRLLQIRDAIEARRHPIARSEHSAGYLRLDSIHVIHQRGWRENAAKIDSGGEEQNNQVSFAAVHRSTAKT